MYTSDSAIDISALADGRRQQQQQQGTTSAASRPVKVLPVSQLAPSSPLIQICRGSPFEGAGQPKTWPETLLPSLVWMKAYNWRDSLKADVLAGVTVGTMLIPQVRTFLCTYLLKIKYHGRSHYKSTIAFVLVELERLSTLWVEARSYTLFSRFWNRFEDKYVEQITVV